MTINNEINNILNSNIAQYNAVISYNDDIINCYHNNIFSGMLSSMQQQVGYREESLSFNPADKQVILKCLKKVIQKTHSSSVIKIVILITEAYDNIFFEIKSEVEKLEQWYEKRYSVPIVIDIKKYSSIEYPDFSFTIDPIIGNTIVDDCSENSKDEACISDNGKYKNEEEDEILKQKINIGDLNDIPLDFNRFSWVFKCKPSDLNSLMYKFCSSFIQTGNPFTILKLREIETISSIDIIYLFDELRKNNNKEIAINMVGFNNSNLWAKSYLYDYKINEAVSIDNFDFSSIEVSTSSFSSTHNHCFLSKKIYQCLIENDNNEMFIDLCEDVISSITGEYNFITSLADAIIIYHILNQSGFNMIDKR